MSLFRAGNEDAFRVIHDRYRGRMLAYTRQMLGGSPQDPEDAVQEVFVRAYGGLRANRRELALRAWLYRIAHNRCVDELRRPHPPVLEVVDELLPAIHDPVAKVEQRDSLRRLIADVQRLPEHQRSALLMRELGGMPYADVSGALGVSVPAVKSLLVRARIGLAQASEARDTACAEIREDLIASHDRGVRTSGLARRHMRDCPNCRQFRAEVRGVSRRFAALAPTLGPIGVLANLLGWGSGGGAAASGGAVAGGGAAAAGTGAAATAGVFAGGAGHMVTLLAAAIVATGGAVEIQHSLATPPARPAHHHAVAARPSPKHATVSSSTSSPSSVSSTQQTSASADVDSAAPAPAQPAQPAQPRPSGPANGAGTTAASHTSAARSADPLKSVPLSETVDPDRMMYGSNSTDGTGAGGGSATTGSSPSTSGTSTGTGSGASGSTTGTGTGGSTTGTGSGSTTGTGTGTGTATGSSGTGTPVSTGGSGTPAGSGTGSSSGTSTGGTGDSTGGTGTGTGSTGTSSGSSIGVGATTSSTGAGRVTVFVTQSR